MRWLKRRATKDPQAQRLRQANDALRKRDYAAAIAIYKEILAADPENLAVLLNLGAAYHLAEQHSLAIECFEKVLQRDAENVTALINVAAAHGALGHLDQGIAALTKALQVDATRQDLHYNLAALYLRKGQIANAMAELELELALHPRHKLARQAAEELRKRFLRR